MKEGYVPVITRRYSRKIALDDIVYIEQIQRRLMIVTEKDEFLSYERLENIECLLDERFFHVLKKIVINVEKISVVENRSVTFVNNKNMCLARESYVRTKQIYNAYLKNLISG